MTMPLHFQAITELAPLIAEGRVSSVDLTKACLAEIEAHNEALNAFITVTAEEALAQASERDAEVSAGRCRGPLHGIPVSLKDLIDQRGVPTTAASRVREGHVAASDAPVTARLREAGAVLVGKTNLHEFAFGTTSDETAYGAVRNPHDQTRSPGGSSGGSAVAILTGMSVASIGTDTGGSIRIPSAACGAVGLKPTHGELPAGGVVPLSRSLDHVGPLARSVADAWLLYLVMRGTPPASGASWAEARRVSGLRLGVPRPYVHDILDDEVRGRFAESLAWLRQAGAKTIDVVIPHAADTAPIYQHTSLPEAAAYHATSVTEHPGRYTPNVRLRIEMGRYVLAEDYARAQRGREVLRAEVDRALADVDALVLPTLPIPAPPIGAATVDVAGQAQSVRSMMLRLTQIFNVTGHPAISIPGGFTSEGLPCGFQIVGRRHETEALLAVAAACEPRVIA
jgi:aspartyl-tRNA(Asn)/glutamyl-tRNA(Gln) amidotransferase subunit A